MLILIIVTLFLFTGIGVCMGYWFASFTKIYDLNRQNSQLKAKSDRLQNLVDYYENKQTQ